MVFITIGQVEEKRGDAGELVCVSARRFALFLRCDVEIVEYVPYKLEIMMLNEANEQKDQKTASFTVS